MKFLNMNENAVSPIVATLVLIVVAVVGAIAVGVIMDGLSQDVGNQVDVNKIGGSSGEILIAGSTTVQPASELLAKAYMAEHKGVKITVQGGGSGTGVSSVGMGIVDIGSASRAVKDAELGKYPDLQTTQIGGSAVVVIAHKDATVDSVNYNDLKGLYQNGTPISDVTKAFQRSEESGTEDTFAEWLGKITINGSIEGRTGNGGVLDAVADTENSIGFVDFGYADGDDRVKILGLIVGEKTYESADSDAILDALSGEDTYPSGLVRPLNYIVNGNPSAVVKDFINFAQSPGAVELFHDVGMYSIVEFA
jgi:phosphate transport system substrate-binding protein